MFQKISKAAKKVLLSYRKLPEKKHYVEFLTAILSVPVLITVIMLNVTNLKSADKTTPSPTDEPKQATVYVPVESKQSAKENSASANSSLPTGTTMTSQGPCKTEIGPVSISSPAEGEVVTNNPASIIVNYKTGEYCAAVWSYRINGQSWSDYDDKSIALYNLTKGNVKLELRVKSIASGQEQILTRNFVYNGNSANPDTSGSNSASPSAN